MENALIGLAALPAMLCRAYSGWTFVLVWSFVQALMTS